VEKTLWYTLGTAQRFLIRSGWVELVFIRPLVLHFGALFRFSTNSVLVDSCLVAAFCCVNLRPYLKAILDDV
jgi:hypothetical protein